MISNIEKNRTREKQILLSLDKLDYLTTSQLQRLHNLGGHRNACRVLQNMDQYLSSFRDTEKVYYLNKCGRDIIGSGKIRKKLNKTTVLHYIIRNDYYIFSRPIWWQAECPIKKPIHIITDAMFQKSVLNEKRYYFLEVDNEQKMYNNQRKIEKYRSLEKSGTVQNKFGYFPILVWVTKHHERKGTLIKKCHDMKVEVMTWDEIR